MPRVVADTLVEGKKRENYCGDVGWSAHSGNDSRLALQPRIHATLNLQPFQSSQNQIQSLQIQTIPNHEPASCAIVRKRTSETSTNSGRKRPKTGQETNGVVDDRPRVGCPFYLKDPTAHSQKASCHGKGFAEPGKLKDHLKDIHSISQETLDRLNYRSTEFKSLKTIEAKWTKTFQILHPDVPKDQIPCPLIKTHREVSHNAQDDMAKLCAALKAQLYQRFNVDLAVQLPELWNEFERLFAAAVENAKNPSTPVNFEFPMEDWDCSRRGSALEWLQSVPSAPPDLETQPTYQPLYALADEQHPARCINPFGVQAPPSSLPHDFPSSPGLSYQESTHIPSFTPCGAEPMEYDDTPDNSMDTDIDDATDDEELPDGSPSRQIVVKQELIDSPRLLWHPNPNKCRLCGLVPRRRAAVDAKPVIRELARCDTVDPAQSDAQPAQPMDPLVGSDSYLPMLGANDDPDTDTLSSPPGASTTPPSSDSTLSFSSWDEEYFDYSSGSMEISDETQAVEVFNSEAVASAMPLNVQSFPLSGAFF